MARERVLQPTGSRVAIPTPAVAHASAPAAVLALQRSAGNRAVCALVGGRSIARYTQAEAHARGKEIAAERGSGKKETELHDYLEGMSQVRATEAETDRRAAAKFKAKGVAKQDFLDDMIDRLMAGIEIAAEFTCDRLADWAKLLAHPTLWDPAGVDVKAAPKLKQVRAHLAKLTKLLTGHDLKAQRKAIEATETAIDGLLNPWETGLGDRVDLLILVKRYTLGHERRKLVIAERIADKYDIRLDSMELIKANKKTYGTKSLEKFVEMQEPEVFSLQELNAIETILQRYAPVLGKNRPKSHGAQPLKYFGRAKYGVDHDDTGDAVRDPGTRGESFAKSKTVGMYDAGATASQFPTGMQQFRGTFAHELAHALIEDVKNKAGEKTIEKYAAATGVWTSRNVTPYQSDTSKKTWDAMKAAGKEAPVTPYGATNAGEDLADAIKYLFEDPAKLKTDCPIRYRWILQNLGTFFESTWFAGLPAAPP
jgi:hypothetical protein